MKLYYIGLKLKQIEKIRRGLGQNPVNIDIPPDDLPKPPDLMPIRYRQRIKRLKTLENSMAEMILEGGGAFIRRNYEVK